MPFIVHGTFDLPAKAQCQGINQYNGKNACGYCRHPGVPIQNEKKTTKIYRYIRREQAETPRTHNETISALGKLRDKKLKNIDGFQKMSAFVGLPDFDLIDGFAIDYLHCVLLGVVPKLVGLWLDSRNWKEIFYIKDKVTLNQRILKIKPISEITKKPRSIF